MALLEIEGLRKAFGTVTVLHELSFVVEEGTFLSLIGPSGCGKTTTLRLVAGFERPDGGTIRLSGRSLSDARGVVSPDKRDMGMVFQSYATWPHLTVRENVVFGLRARRVAAGEIAERYDRVASLLSLEGLADRRPYQLSGGQQQRVSLARALVTEPRVLLLDEPLSNLDAPMRAAMRVELRLLQRRIGLTFVYVTHDQEEALSMSDRVIVMNSGVVEQSGKPEDIYESPRSLFVAQFVGRTNVLHGVLRSVEGPFARVECDGVMHSGVLRGDPRIGSRVVLSIRKDRTRLLTEAPTAELNSLAGIATEVLYFGSEREILVETKDHSHLSCRIPATVPSPAATEAVLVSFDPQDTYVFPTAVAIPALDN